MVGQSCNSVLTAKRLVPPCHQVDGSMIISRLNIESEPVAMLLDAIKAATVLKFLPRGAWHRQIRTYCVYAFYEVLVTPYVIAAEKSFDSCKA